MWALGRLSGDERRRRDRGRVDAHLGYLECHHVTTTPVRRRHLCVFRVDTTRSPLADQSGGDPNQRGGIPPRGRRFGPRVPCGRAGYVTRHPHSAAQLATMLAKRVYVGPLGPSAFHDTLVGGDRDRGPKRRRAWL